MVDWISFQISEQLGKRTTEERWQITALFGISVILMIHYLVFCILQPFYIEDAGISFAYARNFVDGEGFVAYPGGERVEGFSNPLWTFLIALFYAFGMSVWVSSKLLGAIFALLTLPYAYGITKRTQVQNRWAMMVPLLLALSPNFVIWCAGGLENSLYVYLLAWGMWRLLIESEDPEKKPLSAFVFCLVCMTRPEGVMYAVLAGICKLVFAIVDKRWKSFFAWVVLFIVPFVLYQGWRYWYFSWPYPNTYYAKLGKGNQFQPFKWTTKGWKYIVEYLQAHNVAEGKDWSIHMGYALPLLIVGMNGLKEKWQRYFVLGSTLWLALVIGYDGDIFVQKGWMTLTNWIQIRVYSILLVALSIGVTSLLRTGWRARSLLWLLGCSSLFFVLYSGGDWMKAHRWFNIVEIFMIPVLWIGMWELVDTLKLTVPSWSRQWNLPKMKGQTSPSLLLMSVFFIAYAISEIKVSAQFAISPETSVNDVHRRVRYMQWVQRRLDLDHVTLLDVDMGAHMYYSGWDIVDTAGLVDVPIARHSDYDRDFIHNYIFVERKPEFAHCHGGWANTSKIPKNPNWKKDYIEISGYPIGNHKLHIGNHIRKDIFISDVTDDQIEKGILFGEDIRLLEWEIPSPEIAPGGALMILAKWQSVKPRKNDIQVIFGLEQNGEIIATGAFQPGYRWYNMADWRTHEAIEMKFPMPISKTVPEGTYNLWLTVFDNESGVNFRAQSESIKDFQGLSWWNTAQTVQVQSDAIKQANKDRQESLVLSQNGQCEDSWQSWKNATRHVYRDRKWQNQYLAEHQSAVASCYLSKAQNESIEINQIEWLQKAYYWDHRIAGLQEIAEPLAAKLDQRGQDLYDLEDWTGSYEAFSSAMSIMPSWSHTRKKAEAARDKMLNIIPPHEKKSKEPSIKSPKIDDQKGNIDAKPPRKIQRLR